VRYCGVAALANGGAIACGLRLALTHLRGSENVNLFETVHQNTATINRDACNAESWFPTLTPFEANSII